MLERLRACLLGLENAKAVPRADLLFAPMSGMNKIDGTTSKLSSLNVFVYQWFLPWNHQD